MLYSKRYYPLGMKENTQIAEIVRKSDIVVRAEDRISVAYRLMKRDMILYIPVMDQGRVIGIIGRNQIRRLGFGYTYDGREDIEIGMFDMLQVDQVMDSDLPLVALDAPVREVAELMAREDFAALPVVDDGKLAGLIQINDVLLFLLNIR